MLILEYHLRQKVEYSLKLTTLPCRWPQRVFFMLKDRDSKGCFIKGHKINVGEKHWFWKGNKVSYSGMHHWLKRCKGSPIQCQICGTKTAKKFEWANKDHKYNRILDDYISMCTSCHRKYDYANGLSKRGLNKIICK